MEHIWMNTVFLSLLAMAALCALGMVIAAVTNAFIWVMETVFPVRWGRWLDRFVPGDREFDDPMPGVHDLEEGL